MQRKVSSLEHRLTVLYALNALGEASNIQLLAFMTELNLMDYFALELALHDLQTAEYLNSGVHPIGTLYAVTDAGRDALKMFLKRLPVSKQSAIDENKNAYRNRFSKERAIIGDYRVLDNGKCQLELKIGQGDDWLMVLLIILPDAKNVHALIGAFNNRAEEVYGWLFEQLSQGYAPTDEAGKVGLVELLAGAFPEDEFSLTLALPQDLARHFNIVFERENERLKKELLRMLIA